MKSGITDRIIALGGTSDFSGQSLKADIESISFGKTFLLAEFEDYLNEDMCKKIAAQGAIPQEEITYPRITFQHKLFTPFTKGTDDYAEWNSLMDEDTVRGVIGSGELEFLYVGESNGYPNYYFICRSDANKDNPTVYSTDHELFFKEIEVEGTLEEYFGLFVSDEEFNATMESLVEELGSE